jgi:hypothetical protein
MPNRNSPVVGLRSSRRLTPSHHEWKRSAPKSIKRGIERKVRQSASHGNLMNEMLAWAQDDLEDEMDRRDRASYLDFLEECRAFRERQAEKEIELQERYLEETFDDYPYEVVMIGCGIEDDIERYKMEHDPDFVFAIHDQIEDMPAFLEMEHS